MEAKTLERARKGDPIAMARLLADVSPTVHRFGLRLCRHADDANEVVQDTLLSIARNLPSFEGRASLTSWVFTLARTACGRRRRGMKNRPFADADEAPEPLDLAPSPEDTAISRDLGHRVSTAIVGLPEPLRQVVELRDLAGVPAAEAAETLGLTVEALKSRLHRARTILRESLR